MGGKFLLFFYFVDSFQNLGPVETHNRLVQLDGYRHQAVALKLAEREDKLVERPASAQSLREKMSNQKSCRRPRGIKRLERLQMKIHKLEYALFRMPQNQIERVFQISLAVHNARAHFQADGSHLGTLRLVGCLDVVHQNSIDKTESLNRLLLRVTI